MLRDIFGISESDKNGLLAMEAFSKMDAKGNGTVSAYFSFLQRERYSLFRLFWKKVSWVDFFMGVEAAFMPAVEEEMDDVPKKGRRGSVGR